MEEYEIKARGKPEVGSRKSEDRSRKSEDGSQKSEDRSRKSEDGSQKSEDRSRKPKFRLTRQTDVAGQAGRDGPPGSNMISGVPAWLARGTPVECGRQKRLAVQNRLAHKTESTQCLPVVHVGTNEDGIRGTYARGTVQNRLAHKTESTQCLPVVQVGVNEDGISGPNARGMPWKDLTALRHTSIAIGGMNGSNGQPRPTVSSGRAVTGSGQPANSGKPPDARPFDYLPDFVFQAGAQGNGSGNTRGHPPEVEFDGFHRAKLPEMGVVCAGGNA